MNTIVIAECPENSRNYSSHGLMDSVPPLFTFYHARESPNARLLVGFAFIEK